MIASASLLLAGLLLATPASAGEISFGVSAGGVRTAPLEVIGSSWTVVPRVGYMFNDNIGLELDVGILAGKTRVGEEALNYTALTPRLNFVGRLWTNEMKNGKNAPFYPTISGGIGAFYKGIKDGETLDPQFAKGDVDFLVSAGPGIMVPLGPVHLRSDLRWLVNLGTENYENRGDQHVHWEWTAGIGVSFGGATDSDKDGIVDADDQCKDDPEDIDNFEDEDGCPDRDNDGDGLNDTEDAECPNDAEDKDGIQDDDGCPEDDADEDGVADEADSCPLEAGTEAAKGCPDADGDGIADTKDECADEAGSPDARGCVDDDEDRVPDYRDMCPDEKADPRVAPMYSDGCPARVVVSAESIVINEKVQFDTGKATIKSKSFELLSEVAATLKQYANIKKVSIEGHTDNTGDAEKNQKLSEDRAGSVRQHLIEKHEIAEDRLESKGFGSTAPLEGVDADSDEGRAANRRVEFKITEMDKAAAPKLQRSALEFADYEFKASDKPALVVKTAKVAKESGVTSEAECQAVAHIDAEGKVESVQMSKCAGLARSVARRSMQQWTFEPKKVDDKAAAHKATFTWKFDAEGKATVTLDEKSVEPVE